MKRSMTVWVLPALLLLGAGVAGQEEAARPPAWALSFTHGPLEVHSVTYKDGSARSYYYLTFRVENKSETAADLALHFKATVGTHPKKRRVLIATPEPDAEESVRRLARAPDLKNVQQINKMGKLEPGKSVRGIAVFGTFKGNGCVYSEIVPDCRNPRCKALSQFVSPSTLPSTLMVGADTIPPLMSVTEIFSEPIIARMYSFELKHTNGNEGFWRFAKSTYAIP